MSGREDWNDVYIVVSEDHRGNRTTRCVIAGDQDQARQAHTQHHPFDRIIAVKDDVTGHCKGNAHRPGER